MNIEHPHERSIYAVWALTFFCWHNHTEYMCELFPSAQLVDAPWAQIYFYTYVHSHYKYAGLWNGRPVCFDLNLTFITSIPSCVNSFLGITCFPFWKHNLRLDTCSFNLCLESICLWSVRLFAAEYSYSSHSILSCRCTLLICALRFEYFVAVNKHTSHW